MKRVIAAVCLVLFSVCTLSAFEIETGGELESSVNIFPDSSEKNKQVYGEARLRPYATVNTERFLFFLEGYLRLDNGDIAEGFMDNYSSKATQRKNIDLGEVYVEYMRENYFIRVGSQVFDFSALDGVSPNDMVNPRDWSHMIDWEKIPVGAIDLKIGFEDFFEIVYIPYFQPSRLPGETNPWARNMPGGLTLLDQEMPDREDGQVLLRLGSVWGNTEYVFAYFNSYSYSPAYKLDLEQGGVVPCYNRQEVYSFSSNSTWGEFAISSEIAYYDQVGRDDFIFLGVSALRIWSEVFTQADSLSLMLQYNTEDVTHEELENDFDLRRVLQGFQWEAKYFFDSEEMWAFVSRGAWNTDDGDLYLENSVVYQRDDWELTAGLAVMTGDEDTFFGSYDQNDYCFLKINFSF